MPSGALAAVAPPGFISFCLRYRDQCTVPVNAASNVIETPQVWQTLNRVNAEVNTAITPEDDLDHYGRAEYWTIPSDGYGDCDDYALTKRKALIDAGLPSRALRVAVVQTSQGDRHAVLTVSTDHGDYVLDNLREEILPWDQGGYIWVERQDAVNAWNWVAFRANAGGPAVAVTDGKASPTAELQPRAALSAPEKVALLSTLPPTLPLRSQPETPPAKRFAP